MTFWKIYSWSQEKKRIGDSLIKAGIKKGDEFTDAAVIQLNLQMII